MNQPYNQNKSEPKAEPSSENPENGTIESIINNHSGDLDQNEREERLKKIGLDLAEGRAARHRYEVYRRGGVRMGPPPRDYPD